MEKNLKILTVNKRDEEKILRNKAIPFDFTAFTRKEIDALVKKMREMMIQANGIGLAANQVGLNFRIFVAQIPKSDAEGDIEKLSRVDTKFYAIFNPEIVKIYGEKNMLEEGCLSVPDVYGNVMRAHKIAIAGFDKTGKKIKIKAWGILARVFQHEIDHLNGVLYIDKAKHIMKTNPTKS